MACRESVRSEVMMENKYKSLYEEFTKEFTKHRTALRKNYIESEHIIKALTMSKTVLELETRWLEAHAHFDAGLVCFGNVYDYLDALMVLGTDVLCNLVRKAKLSNGESDKQLGADVAKDVNDADNEVITIARRYNIDMLREIIDEIRDNKRNEILYGPLRGSAPGRATTW